MPLLHISDDERHIYVRPRNITAIYASRTDRKITEDTERYVIVLKLISGDAILLRYSHLKTKEEAEAFAGKLANKLNEPEANLFASAELASNSIYHMAKQKP